MTRLEINKYLELVYTHDWEFVRTTITGEELFKCKNCGMTIVKCRGIFLYDGEPLTCSELSIRDIIK